MNEPANDNNISLLWQRLARSITQASVWYELAQAYATRGLPWQAAYAARQTLRLDTSQFSELQIQHLGNWRDNTTGDALLARGQLPEASRLMQQFYTQLTHCPGDWLTCLYLARVQEIMTLTESESSSNPTGYGLPSVEQTLKQAQRLEPVAGESLHWMGLWRLRAGDARGAVTALSGVLDIRPLRYGSMMYLGEALFQTGQREAAEKAFARASRSMNADFLLTLSTVVYAHHYRDEAIAVLEKAHSIKPDNVPILLALAKIQSELYALSDSRETLSLTRILAPDNPEVDLLEAGIQGRMGDAKAQLDMLQAVYASSGDPLSRLASSIAMASLYHDSMTPTEVAALHRRLCIPIETAITEKTDFNNAMIGIGDRRLRIGYVTGDLHRQHPVNVFMLPVLLRHDHTRFDICVYHTGKVNDEYTEKARDCVDRWRDAAALDDAALQQAIVADEVDILVDLAGHTASHRLGVFALRAAPVQASFLGYPHSTGLSTIDWMIGDPAVSPAEHSHLFSEGIAQLPHSVFCWAPVDEYPLPPSRKPEDPVTFGSFNNVMKLSSRTIALWARILLAVPESSLLLKASSFRNETVHTRFLALFGEYGVGPERLIMHGPSDLGKMMQTYGDIDIALDPVPYNGGTTTLQALWMGVPVVTLAGGNFVGRMGASFLNTLGQREWIASSENEYVKKAVCLARDCDLLRRSRATLREQMAASPLCDINEYVLHLEALFCQMWALHGEGDRSEIISAERIASLKGS